MSLRAVHDLWHHLIDVSDLRSRLGDPVAGQTGMLDQISVSQGGVPKTAVTSADVGRLASTVMCRRHGRITDAHGRPYVSGAPMSSTLWSPRVIRFLPGPVVRTSRCRELIGHSYVQGQ